MKASTSSFAVACATCALAFGCSGNDGGTVGAQGGAYAVGGSATLGGGATVGGAPASGGDTTAGGVNSGGMAAGGTNSSGRGGSTTTGGSAPYGGEITGGAKATGGAPVSGGGPGVGGLGTGGKITGGASTGGNNTGGASTGGGPSRGGSSTGGANTGGVSTGDASTGGASTGGSSAAGSSAGGASTGGVSAGGGNTGGASTHMYTKGSDLYASCGEKVLLRGVNQMSVWTDASGSSYPTIASFGSNAIRIVYVETGSASGLDALLTKAEASKMIPMPEIHDATGKFDGVAAAVNWWTQASVVSVIKKHEKWTLLNIANEAGDNNVSDATFQSTYTSAIASLRNAGITVPIVVDGTGWGQRVEQLLAVAPALLAADPQRNIIFSWHEYTGGSQENARITSSYEKSKSLGIVLINGEFASGGAGVCTQNIPYKFLLSEAQRVGIGWFAWSWDTSNSDCNSGSGSIFNMTTNLTSASGLVAGWASDVVRDDPNSIKNTSVRHCDWK